MLKDSIQKTFEIKNTYAFGQTQTERFSMKSLPGATRLSIRQSQNRLKESQVENETSTFSQKSYTKRTNSK